MSVTQSDVRGGLDHWKSITTHPARKAHDSRTLNNNSTSGSELRL